MWKRRRAEAKRSPVNRRKTRTPLGELFLSNAQEARDELMAALERNAGSATHAAREMGCTKRWVYYLLYREQLWDELDALRARLTQKRKNDWKEAARRALQN